MLGHKIGKIILSIASFATIEIATSGAATALTFRSIDGSGNNLTNTTWGQSNDQFIRLLPTNYGDGFSSLAGADRPNPRAISNTIANQTSSVTTPLNASDWLWQWGQFIDHDLDLGLSSASAGLAPIVVPNNDPIFAPGSTIPFTRNNAAPGTGTDPGNPRQQINGLTSYIDASMVYGSDQTRANSLRTFSGGKLLTSVGNLLPLAANGRFIAGDTRANEQIGLMSVQTLLMREHNRLADEIAGKITAGDATTITQLADSGLSQDEFIYQTARKIVGAQIQVITYNEFLPLLIGANSLGDYNGYDPNVNASVSNEFANAAYRVGHTMLSPQILRINNDGTSLAPIRLRDAFLSPAPILNDGIDSILLGLASQKSEKVDALVVDDVRNFLFGGIAGRDLVSINIQRGRDNGFVGYNAARVGLGLGGYTSFDQITSNSDIAQRFRDVYGTTNGQDNLDLVDLWMGGIAEDAVNGGSVGELFNIIISDQFRRARDGDRFFYLNDSDLLDLAPDIDTTRLSDLIRRNSTITNIQDNAFIAREVPEPSAVFSLFALGVLGGGLRLLRKGK